MSKELAAAILTQTYFQSSNAAADRVRREVEADSGKGAAPASGAIATIVKVYQDTLTMMDKFAPTAASSFTAQSSGKEESGPRTTAGAVKP